MFEWITQLPLWIWLYFGGILITCLTFAIWFFIETIKKYWFKTFYPEQLIKVLIFYPTGMFKAFYRLLPSDKLFNIKGKSYIYSDETIQKQKEFFCNVSESPPKLTIDKKEYDFLNKCKIKTRFSSVLEIHYFENNPNPIDYTKSATTKDAVSLAKFSSKELKQIKDNDLVIKLLSLQGQNNMLLILLFVAVAGLIVNIVLLMIELGFIQVG